MICPPSSPAPPGMEIILIRACCRSSSVSITWSRTSLPSMATVCNSMHPSPAAFKRGSRVGLKWSGRSKLTHERTLRPSHLIPCGITFGWVICSWSNRWVPSSKSTKSRWPYACFARRSHPVEPSRRMRLYPSSFGSVGRHTHSRSSGSGWLYVPP